MSRGASQDRKDLEEALRADARQMLFSNSVVDEFVASATLAELRAVGGLC